LFSTAVTAYVKR